MSDKKRVNKKEFRKTQSTESRLEYLIKTFNVVDNEELYEMVESSKHLPKEEGGTSLRPIFKPQQATLNSMIKLNTSENLLVVLKKVVIKEKLVKEYFISDIVFGDIIKSDPTENKSNVQWMLQTFLNSLEHNVDEGIRFATEDLIAANDYLVLFEKHKKKKRFKEWAIKNEYRKWNLLNKTKSKKDWDELGYNQSDITQYKSLGQLFDAIDPFRERNHSDLEKAMEGFMHVNEAEIEYKDRYWTVYVPKTKSANCVMQNFAGWCTAQPDQGMFDSYVSDQRQPNGEKSKIYVVVNNELFEGRSDETYQIHFESSQIKDKSNGYGNVDLYELIFEKPHGEGIHEYFHAELDRMAREDKGSITNNKYIDYLISFGFTESLFDYLEDDTNSINFNGNKKIPKLPDLSRFQKVDQLILMGVGLKELHPSVCNLEKLELLSLSDNKLTTLPREIGKLKNVDIINLKGNPLTSIPDEIAELDRSNGGTLYRVSVNLDDVGQEVYDKLKRLLPTAVVGE